MYKIGFYNDKVDNKDMLIDCNIIFNDINKLKEHVRRNDTIVLCSLLSLFGVATMDFLMLKEKYNLNITCIDYEIKDSAMNNFQLTTMLSINEYIYKNKSNIIKLY